MLKKTLNFIPLLFILFIGCNEREKTPFKIDYEKYQLDNGLTVILHEDKSDPIVGIAIQYHVGSIVKFLAELVLLIYSSICYSKNRNM